MPSAKPENSQPDKGKRLTHDQNFKNLILDYPMASIEFYAPEEAKRVIEQKLKITPIRQEMLQEKLGHRYRELDTPVLLEHPDKKREGLAFVFEEESQTRYFSIHHLARYCLDISELFKTESVVPVVIFLQKSARAKKKLRLGSKGDVYLEFRYVYFSLAEQHYTKWQDSDNPVAILNLPCMQYKKHEKLDMYYRTTKRFFQLEKNPKKLEKYIDFIDHYANLNEDEFKQFTETYPEEGKTMLSFSERYTQKGMQQGMQIGLEQGIEQGIEKGLISILLIQLQSRFGEVPPNINEKIERADMQELNRWLVNILEAETIEGVFV